MRHLKNSPHNDPKAEAPGAIRDAVYSEAGQEVRKRWNKIRISFYGSWKPSYEPQGVKKVMHKSSESTVEIVQLVF